MKQRSRKCILTVLATLMPWSAAIAESPRVELKSANDLLTAGSYDESLPHFDAAAESTDPALRAPALHNRAIALYRLGRFADARETWVRLLADADAPLEARTRYNIGNTHYQETLIALQPPADPGAAQPTPLSGLLAQLDKAILQYRDALRLDPALLDARANLELALRLRDELKNQSKPQSQPSSQPNQQQQQSPESQPSDQQQKNDQEQNQQDQQEQQRQDQQQQGNGQNGNQNASQSDENNNGNQNAPGQSENENTNGNRNENGAGQSQSEEEQQNSNANANPEQGDSSDAQPKPTDPSNSQPPEPAAENGNGNGNGNSSVAPLTGDTEAQPADPNGEPPPGAVILPRTEAERILQMIRDAEKARREAIRARLRMHQPKVDRDW